MVFLILNGCADKNTDAPQLINMAFVENLPPEPTDDYVIGESYIFYNADFRRGFSAEFIKYYDETYYFKGDFGILTHSNHIRVKLRDHGEEYQERNKNKFLELNEKYKTRLLEDFSHDFIHTYTVKLTEESPDNAIEIAKLYKSEQVVDYAQVEIFIPSRMGQVELL